MAKLAGPLAMAYSEPSIRPKISQIIWLRYFCSAARIALMEIATPASTPKPGVGAQQGQPHHDTSATSIIRFERLSRSWIIITVPTFLV